MQDTGPEIRRRKGNSGGIQMHNATMDGRGREKAAEEGTRGNPNYNQNRIRKPEAKKNKAPPQPPVLHSQDTAEREDEGNSNQPAEDIGNTTPQNEAEELGTDQRGQWNEVVRRRRHRIIGTNHNDEHLQAAVKKGLAVHRETKRHNNG